MSQILEGPDGRPRCFWCVSTPQYIAYHDTEWGFPVADDRRLFEKLTLESFQSGLSWRTILDKRENFRVAFENFDFAKIAAYSNADIARLLGDKGIVRHRGKIEATINNSQRACALLEEKGSLARYFWSFAPSDDTPHRNQTVSPLAKVISADLKKRGWKFVGPTTVHSFIQAMGLINDHAEGCEARERATQARAIFKSPT